MADISYITKNTLQIDSINVKWACFFHVMDNDGSVCINLGANVALRKNATPSRTPSTYTYGLKKVWA